MPRLRSELNKGYIHKTFDVNEKTFMYIYKKWLIKLKECDIINMELRTNMS